MTQSLTTKEIMESVCTIFDQGSEERNSLPSASLSAFPILTTGVLIAPNKTVEPNQPVK